MTLPTRGWKPGPSGSTFTESSPPVARVPERGRGAEEIINKTIGQYEVTGKIGQGGMGVVYRARQVPLNRMVALKMILAGQHADPKTIARFILEGKAVARLRHPNVVHVYELGEHEGLPYYSMELVEGSSLLAKLVKGPMEPREAAELVRTLALAADYAHGQGVVHRDLKPGNILFAPDGTPKITDFGLAKLLDGDSGNETFVCLTGSDAIIGTASYMAPEQAEGRSKDITRATDVYALGVILYETLTGRPPLVGENRVRTLEMVRTTEPTPPSRVRPEIPFHLGAICLKCLEKLPARRYASAQALADDLDSWLRDERPRGTPSGLTRLGRRLRRRPAAVLVVLALMPVGPAFYLNSPQRVVAAIQDDLAHRKPATLIGETGKPRWFHWQAGKSRSQLVLADDNTLTIQAWTLSLLELVPDPQCESYRFIAQVRHEKSDAAGEVGLFFAHKMYPGNPGPIHFFTQLTFNAVRGNDAYPTQLPDGTALPRLSSTVWLFPHLYTDEAVSPRFDGRIMGVTGPKFKPLGEHDPRWNDLEVVVTSEKISARWNGEPLSITTSQLQLNITDTLRLRAHRQDDPLPPTLRPTFDSRGGLGLYLFKGSASFRAVTVAPL